jgi:hypothetical protein
LARFKFSFLSRLIVLSIENFQQETLKWGRSQYTPWTLEDMTFCSIYINFACS